MQNNKDYYSIGLDELHQEGTALEYLEAEAQIEGKIDRRDAIDPYIFDVNKICDKEDSLASRFTFKNNELDEKVCIHTLSRQGENEPLIEKEFPFTKEFIEKILNPMINHYALRNEQEEEIAIADAYKTTSKTNNSLVFNNISEANVEYIKKRIGEITPAIIGLKEYNKEQQKAFEEQGRTR